MYLSIYTANPLDKQNPCKICQSVKFLEWKEEPSQIKYKKEETRRINERNSERNYEKMIIERKENIRKKLDINCIGKDYENITIDDYKQNKELHKKLSNYINNFEKMKEKGLGMFFFGEVGRGKTHLASALVNSLIIKYYNLDVMSVNLPKIISQTKRGFGDNNAKDYFAKMEAVELLFIDDFGAEMEKEWVKDSLYQIINERINWKRPTIITSNVPLEPVLDPKTKKVIIEGLKCKRTTSRIQGCCFPLECLGIDKRKNKLNFNQL